MYLLLLLLLSLITYIIVQSLSSVTRTPVPLLWLVAMTPAFIWTGWILIKGNEKPPMALLWVPFIVCLVLYWCLIQWGRIPRPTTNSTVPPDPDRAGQVPVDNTVEPAPLHLLDKEEESNLQNCFPWSVYYLQNIEHRPQAVICRGQLRSKPEVAYQTIQENVQERFGDRFFVMFQEGPSDKPFFVLVPNPRSRSANPQAKAMFEAATSRPVLAMGLLIATFFTTALAWLQLTGKPIQPSLAAVTSGFPYAIALMTILGVHELAHYLAARRYRIQATLPYFIPVLPMSIFPFGTFGAFIQIRSPIPHRRALFDVGIAGPMAGLVMALPLLIWGLANSNVVPLPAKPEVFNFQALDPDFSLLLALLSKLALGSQLTPETAIKLHPVAVAGCLGVVVTALNLTPVGQLDGGHIVHAMFGQRTGAAIGQVSRWLLLLLALIQPYLLLWAIVLFLMPAKDEPALNDVTELDNRRDFWGLVALALFLLIVLPTPTIVSSWLNI